MSVKLKYFVSGFIFGLCFPIFAIVIQLEVGHIKFSLEGIIEAHHQNILIYVIDTAPLWLGLFALIGGFSKAKTLKLLDEFKSLAEHLNQSNEQLKNYSENTFSEIISSTNEIQNLTNVLHESNDKLFQYSTSNKSSAGKLNESTSVLMHSTTELILHNKELKTQNDNTFNEFANFEKLVVILAENFNKINDISTEIKVLSINSSIEANRYGEQGKGFRTISGQIKVLSESIDDLNTKTQNITNEVATQIKKIHHYIDDQNLDLNKILDLISVIEKSTTQSEENLNWIFANLENSNEIHINQKNQFDKVNSDINSLAQNKSELIEKLKLLMVDNSALITRISKL